MKLINPAGNAMTPDGNTIQPRACMCSSKKNFANAKGSDGCFHCGCSCSDMEILLLLLSLHCLRSPKFMRGSFGTNAFLQLPLMQSGC